VTGPALPTQLSPSGLLSARYHILSIHLLYGHHLARIKSLTRRQLPLLRQRPSHHHAHAQTAKIFLHHKSSIPEPYAFPLTCSQVTTPHPPTSPNHPPPGPVPPCTLSLSFTHMRLPSTTPVHITSAPKSSFSQQRDTRRLLARQSRPNRLMSMSSIRLRGEAMRVVRGGREGVSR
jgi:hypothetical protein